LSTVLCWWSGNITTGHSWQSPSQDRPERIDVHFRRSSPRESLWTKAFDTVDCTTLWKILETYGCPDKLVNIIKQFHYEIKAQVSVGSEPSDAFVVNHGVKQGCVLAPSLFSLYLTAVLETMNEGLNRSVFIRTRTDGKLLNLAQLRAPTKTLEMVSENCSMLMTQPLWPTTQLICSRLWVVSPQQLICLVLRSTYPRPSCSTSLLQCPLNCQRWLRSMMNHWRRLSLLLTWAAPSQTPTLQIWKWKGGSNLPGRPRCATKETLDLSWHQYKNQSEGLLSCSHPLPALFHRVTTLYCRHVMALTRLQLRHLCSILKIKWEDHIPDVEVLHRAHTVSVEALITISQLCWAGHLCRMANSRLPKGVFYSELSQGKRNHGGQKLRFKDVLKRHMKKTGISHDTWEEEAVQRVKKHWMQYCNYSSLPVEMQLVIAIK